ncbi:MAG: TlpA family protein disulfide reductase, partial [Gammaproteobacteria bacterium]|nr:TlpA family protein disulfide reductase [Gammaproteobacteria bacterium]
WATWCPPCVEELPSLNRLQQRYSGQPFNLISVDFRESREELERFTGKIPVDFPILLDQDGKSSLAWQVFSFPSSFLVDRQGRIRYSINRAIDWETPEVYALIDSLLAEAEPSAILTDAAGPAR